MIDRAKQYNILKILEERDSISTWYRKTGTKREHHSVKHSSEDQRNTAQRERIRKYGAQQVADLSDRYLRGILKKTVGGEPTREMLSIKRAQVRLLRALRHSKTKEKNNAHDN